MAAYNSRVGTVEDDSDISIIHPSIMDEDVDNTYVPIITRLLQANHSSENRQITNSHSNNNQPVRPSGVGSNDYIFIDHDPLQNAKQLEQVLMFYIRDLKQESNNQLDCDKQLVTRIMDLIRPAYVDNQQKMIQLDKVVEEIGVLHDKRHIEQQEKLEQLRADRNRLQRMMFPASNDQGIYNNHSMFSTLHQGYQSTDVEQWTEIEDDAKKLHELVESQRNLINEIVSLITETVAASARVEPSSVLRDNTGNATADNQLPPTPSTTAIDNLLKKVQDLTRFTLNQQPQPPVTIAPTPLINHSPGASPTESFSTLTLTTLRQTSVDQKTEEVEPPVKKDEPVFEKPHEHIDILVPPSPPSPDVAAPVLPPEAKKCPVCNHEFPSASDDVEMYDHIEKCLFPSGAAVEPKDFECPNCNRKYPGNDDSAYLQHLSDCYNQGF